MPVNCLYLPAAFVIGSAAVQDILGEVTVVGTQVIGHDIHQDLVGQDIIIAVNCFPDGSDRLIENVHDIAVNRLEILISNHVLLRIEVFRIDIAEQEAEGIADLAVLFRDLLDVGIAQTDILGKVGNHNPQTEHIRAVDVDDIHRVNTIAQGLGHLFTLGIADITMGQDGLVRGPAVGGCADDQRRIEPASVLIRTLEVQITRIVIAAGLQFIV